MMSEVHDESTDSAEEWEAPVNAVPDDNPLPKTQPLIGQLGGVERELAGELVHVVFMLPGGATVKRDHYMGQTIACLKAQLEDLNGLPYEKTTLYLGDRPLLDPLSLNDLPFKEGEENHVSVRFVE
ncbi:hypothetical protein DQ04_00941050 [Trypanosoma grayi]|uniref:hypothetical protein n=1 Tax=Trypanosoma grayi TaxID=71804 RepID=UPI0004F4233F|nr:hypothetical protein DQ04_00941050 [Trypanosoma grayi]KEG13541.1 hypothetical protein DQ04_00941050 [Trypanosoma grayi]